MIVTEKKSQGKRKETKTGQNGSDPSDTCGDWKI